MGGGPVRSWSVVNIFKDMNEVKLSSEPKIGSYLQGDLFIDPDDKEMFILSNLGNGKWVAVSASIGNTMCGPQDSITEAVDGLTFYARNATITVEP